jgi:hypothetical protein
MTKKDNLYSEVVINESPFYYDDHGRLRVHVLNEAEYISTADMRMDPVTGKKGPSKTIEISKDNDGTSRNVTFYSCNIEEVRTGFISTIGLNSQGITDLNVFIGDLRYCTPFDIYDITNFNAFQELKTVIAQNPLHLIHIKKHKNMF